MHGFQWYSGSISPSLKNAQNKWQEPKTQICKVQGQANIEIRIFVLQCLYAGISFYETSKPFSWVYNTNWWKTRLCMSLCYLPEFHTWFMKTNPPFSGSKLTGCVGRGVPASLFITFLPQEARTALTQFPHTAPDGIPTGKSLLAPFSYSGNFTKT